VKSKGPWDFKRDARDEVGVDEKNIGWHGNNISKGEFGNLHYGAMGRVLGLSRTFVLKGSLAAHLEANGALRGALTLRQEVKDWSMVNFGYVYADYMELGRAESTPFMYYRSNFLEE
jgi:hypothetical protein